jgi:hypothetical protein
MRLRDLRRGTSAEMKALFAQVISRYKGGTG